ncbi:MAG: hypothetical protein JXB60_03615 [Candidatus Cloacimonetes bacterium]|nr:hypothetical protein [Candidatus Cloacimonadota bacterium]
MNSGSNRFVIFASLLIIVFSIPLIAFQSTNYLPLGASMAEGYEMPLPMGLGLTYYFQDQFYELDQIWIDIEIFDPEVIADEIKIDNHTTEMSLKLDMWLFPFLNLFGLFGKVEGNTDIDLGTLYSDMKLSYDGYVYGIGANLAGGWKSTFANFNATYTRTRLDQEDSSVEAWIISPKVGLHFNQPWILWDMSIWTGGMYQEYDERHTGKIDVIGFGNVSYDVTLAEKESWNYLLGLTTGLSRHIHLEFEGGFGKRSQLASSLTYRF